MKLSKTLIKWSETFMQTVMKTAKNGERLGTHKNVKLKKWLKKNILVEFHKKN
jgi:hypothetical protein